MADSEVRQKFEAWAAPRSFLLHKEADGRYAFPATDYAWNIYEAGMRAGEIAQQEKAERNYARGFDHAVRDIVAALARQFNQEVSEDRKLGLHVALNTASGYHGFMDDPAAPEEKKPALSGAEESKK